MEKYFGAAPSKTKWKLLVRGGIHVESDLQSLHSGHQSTKSLVVSTTSKYQQIEVWNVFSNFHYQGRALFLDGVLQSAESDEYVYHEALVHPALSLHGRAERVLVVGGGEGATLREILKHRPVARVDMVELDGDVVAVSEKYLDSWSDGAFKNPKVHLKIGDGKKFIQEAEDRTYDVIVLDLLDPGEFEKEVDNLNETSSEDFDAHGEMNNGRVNMSGVRPGASHMEFSDPLYSPNFFESIKAKLKDDGMLVTHCGSIYPFEYEYLSRASRFYGFLLPIFPAVSVYGQFIHSFEVMYIFLIGCKDAKRCGLHVPESIVSMNVQKPLFLPVKPLVPNLRVATYLKTQMSQAPYVYDELAHYYMFGLPKTFREQLKHVRKAVQRKYRRQKKEELKVLEEVKLGDKVQDLQFLEAESKTAEN